jgi:hypothetical protein
MTTTCLFGQDDDYYQIPTQRQIKGGQIALPNLKIENIRWYLRPYGGVKWQKSSFEEKRPDKFKSSHSPEMWWALNFGINKNDKWEIELGYQKFPQKLEWQPIGSDKQPIYYYFTAKNIDDRIQLQYKRRLLYADRVTKKTRLNLIAGVQASPWRTETVLRTMSVGLLEIPYPQGTGDTLRIETRFNRKKNVISGLLGFELIGRIADPLEIGFFSMLAIDPAGVLNSDIQMNSSYFPPVRNRLYLRGFSALFGLSLRWNFLNGIRYTADGV